MGRDRRRWAKAESLDNQDNRRTPGLRTSPLADFASARGPLAGCLIVECGEGVPAAFAARLMADLGADVIKVEAPSGDVLRRRGPFAGDIADPENSGLFLYLNANKRGITLDLECATGRERLDRLLARADILVHNVPPALRAALGLRNERLVETFPHLITASVSAYGDSGPRAGYHAYELNAFHSGGVGSVSPLNSPYPELPPLRLFGNPAEYEGGLHAAMAVLAALWHRMESGRGQAIDVCEQEALAATLQADFVLYSYSGQESSRFRPRRPGPWFVTQCADGYVLFSLLYDNDWTRFKAWIGNPPWARDPDFADTMARGRNIGKLRPLIEDWLRSWTVRELFAQARAHLVPIVPVSKIADVYASEQLAAREFFVPLPLRDGERRLLMPGAPFKSTAAMWSLRRPAPALGEHNGEIQPLLESETHPDRLPSVEFSPEGARAAPPSQPAPPLEGVRVLDFMQLWVGTFCSLQLAHLGAAVIRVESSLRPCHQRNLPPFADGQRGLNRAGIFNQWNQGKRSIQLDVRHPQGLEIARRLATRCDVVTENFAPGVMQRMGLGYEALRALRPDLIMLSITGNGQTGPYRNDTSYGTTVGALSGIYWLCGYPGGEPLEPGWYAAESIAALTGAMGVAAALIHRARTGEGQHIDLAMLETAELVMGEALMEFALNGREPRRLGNRDRMMAPHNCYKTKGGPLDWVTIAVGNEREWRALCAAIGQPGLADDPRFANAQLRKANEDQLDAIITAWTQPRERWEITRQLQAAGVAAIPVMSSKDLAADPHLAARRFFPELIHPEVGHRLHTGIPWTMSATPCRVRRPAPLFGADTEEILGEVLGLSSAQIQRLRESGALR
jgi:crotonobetainyl-CoA:carnitine CoA-transferase CaiB-like acyl-CoA transferase